MSFVVIPFDRNLSCIRCTYSMFRSDTFPVDIPATNTLRPMKHQLLALYDQADMLHMLVECLVNDMCLVDMVRNAYRYLIVVPMSIRRGILRAMLLQPNVSFGRDRITNMRMNPRPVDKIHDRTNDTNRFPNLNICQADNVPYNQLPNVHLDQLLHRCDRRCLDISSIAADQFPIDMCPVDMKRMSYSIDRNMCRQRKELQI